MYKLFGAQLKWNRVYVWYGNEPSITIMKGAHMNVCIEWKLKTFVLIQFDIQHEHDK